MNGSTLSVMERLTEMKPASDDQERMHYLKKTVPNFQFNLSGFIRI